MTKETPRPDKATLWGVIDRAAHGGWGQTLRAALMLALIGGIVVMLAVFGGGHAAVGVQNLLEVLRQWK